MTPNCILMLARSPAVREKTIDLALTPAHTSGIKQLKGDRDVRPVCKTVLLPVEL